ncbi:hypothetical protein HYE53_00080, partial [Aggregatibacter actinomycetemcomitans]|nr:hypothetical protein [Aggregatibacter actinomycetemcomitans]
FLIYDYFTSQSIINDMKWAISVDWGLEKSWNFIKSEYLRDGYETFKAEMLEMHWSNRYWGWFYILFPLFWFFMVASPKWRPVRFDAKRRLV